METKNKIEKIHFTLLCDYIENIYMNCCIYASVNLLKLMIDTHTHTEQKEKPTLRETEKERREFENERSRKRHTIAI